MPHLEAIGVDLGVKRVRAAVYTDNQVTMVPGKDGDIMTPACCSYTYTRPNNFHDLVGDVAVEAMKNGRPCLSDIKRILGRNFMDPEVQKLILEVNFQIINKDGSPLIEMPYEYWKDEKKLFYPEEVAAKILKYVKEQADALPEAPTGNAILTVPSTFTQFQRKAMKDSARLAGFATVEIITEATAAVIAYLEKYGNLPNNMQLASRIDTEVVKPDLAYPKQLPKNVLVFDFGMCTFDLTLLKIEGKTISVLAGGGDPHLGGQLLNQNMVEYVTSTFRNSHGGQEFEKHLLSYLQNQCEKEKKMFSQWAQYVYIRHGPGFFSESTTITNETFDLINAEIFTKLSNTLVNFLQAQQKDPKISIDHVILVGGSTLLPNVKEIIRASLPEATLLYDIDVETIVASGAAIFAMQEFREVFPALNDFNEILMPIKVNGICTPAAIGLHFTYDYQIRRNNNMNYGILIHKGTQVPCYVEGRFWFSVKNGSVTIKVVEGDSSDASQNYTLGSIELTGLRGSYCEVAMQMYLGASGDLKIRFARVTTFSSQKWDFATFNVFDARKVNHFYIHRRAATTVDLSKSSRTDQTGLYSVQLDTAGVSYQKKMDPLISSLGFVQEEKLKEAHQKSVAESLHDLSETYPLLDELKAATKAYLDKMFAQFLELNKRKASSSSKHAIGMDLGTSFCCLAYVGGNGVEIIPDAYSNNFIASCVSLEENYINCGTKAKDHAPTNPENTIIDIKRMIGRNFHTPEVVKFRKYWPFKTLDDNGNICVDSMGKLYRPEDLLTHLLAHLKEAADLYLSEDVLNVVVAIPAYFTPRQKYLTKQACYNAGFNVLKLLNEPTAAALAYNIISPMSKSCLIFDLGGGTFDVAILEFETNRVKLKAIDGNPFLGGVDFDNALIEYCVDEFEKNTGVRLRDTASARKAIRRLRDACEKAKEALSYRRTVLVDVEAIYTTDSTTTDLVVTISRERFESLIENKLKMCMDIVDKVVAKVPQVKISEVVLVGGSSLIPRVQELLKEKFGEGVTISRKVRTNEAVARGAALLAEKIHNRKGDINFEDLEEASFMYL